MLRLNQKAFKILATEITKAAAKDTIAGEVAHRIAFQRLNKLRHQKGTPVTEIELKELFKDILPEFSARIIQKAVRVNRPPSKLWLLPKVGIGIISFAGVIWLINLPYPMIRRPVARKAPILLLPSYLSMDRHYRQAIAKVEQADQLVNNATSLADLQLGAEKVAQAQQHLDKLPVWFIGYEPQIYRTFFNIGGLFTFDEFKAARAKIGRMEAKVFQETNAMQQLKLAETAIERAKQDYQQAPDELNKTEAIVKWQNGIDELTHLPSDTEAGKTAKTKLNSYRRDFQAVSGLIAGNNRTNTLISVAKAFADRAITRCQNPPHSKKRWQQCANLWQEAISRLNRVPLEDPGYLEAQSLLANYQIDLGEVEIRQQTEANSLKAFEFAYSQIVDLPKQVDDYNRDRVIRQIQQIIIQLEKVSSGTTVYEQALDLLASAEQKLQEIER